MIELAELNEWLSENTTNAFSHEAHLKLITILKGMTKGLAQP